MINNNQSALFKLYSFIISIFFQNVASFACHVCSCIWCRNNFLPMPYQHRLICYSHKLNLQKSKQLATNFVNSCQHTSPKLKSKVQSKRILVFLSHVIIGTRMVSASIASRYVCDNIPTLIVFSVLVNTTASRPILIEPDLKPLPYCPTGLWPFTSSFSQ